MVVNMDTELQRLICVSVEKMTREPGTTRKGKGLDLRKALLVAHVLQDMRSAYIADDYKVLVNTVCPEIPKEGTNLRKEYDECLPKNDLTSRRRKFLSDDWSCGSIERPPRSEGSDDSNMTSPYRCPSGTQSCLLTCSDATMSKISQITHPLPVSINTSYILSHQTGKDEQIEVDDTPSVSEQVEVTSTNESESEGSEAIQCEDILSNEDTMDTTVPTYTDLSDSKETNRQVTCPLPRKKRPLPKEFLEQVTIPEVESKRTKLDHIPTTVTSSLDVCDVTVTSSPCRLLNTTTATTVTQSTALSCSKTPCTGGVTQSTQFCSTVTSSVCVTTLVTSCPSVSHVDSNPKVIVEMMTKPSSLWTLPLPTTCTQSRLSRCLVDGYYRSQLADISNLRESGVHTLGLKNLVAV